MKILNILLLTLLLSSCVTMHYGNLTVLAQNQEASLVQDAVSQ